VRRLAALVIASFLGCSGGLEVERVEPGVLPAGARAELRVVGAGFEDGVAFALSSGAADVALGPVVVESASSALAEVPPAAPAGLYDVVATLGGDEARLPDALEIVAGEALIVFIDVDQGDATLIVSPSGEVALIDGGPSDARAAVRRAIDTYAGGRLDVAILSHHDADHLGGLVGLLAGNDTEVGTSDDLEIPEAYAPDDSACDTLTCDRFRALRGFSAFSTPDVGEIIPLGDVELEVVAVEGDVGAGATGAQDPNERSLVVMVRFADREVLVLGDLTGGGEGTVDLEGPLSTRTGPVDVLRTGHHGSRTSSNAAALQRWAPLAAVLSLGTDNTYCHPAQEVLDRLADSVPRVFSTGLGIQNTGSRCDATDADLAGVRLGIGDIVLRIDREGAMTLADEPL
jgi:beta-lactamase superfamily II metal-dependent hydrolase